MDSQVPGPILMPAPDRQQLDPVSEIGGEGDVLGGDLFDPLGKDLLYGNMGVRDDPRQQRQLVGGIVPVDIQGRIGLGEALLLGLLHRLVIAEPCLLHPRQHVVARTVENSAEVGNLVGDQPVLENLDDGDRGRDTGLVVHATIVDPGDLEDLLTMEGKSGLVGGYDILSIHEGINHPLPWQIDTTGDLHHQLNIRIACHLTGIGGEDIRLHKAVNIVAGLLYVSNRDLADLDGSTEQS